jgi:hypothetical protein
VAVEVTDIDSKEEAKPSIEVGEQIVQMDNHAEIKIPVEDHNLNQGSMMSLVYD